MVHGLASTYHSAMLTQPDIAMIDRLLDATTAQYNDTVDADYPKINWNKTKCYTQMIAALSADGKTKMVWVNCLCGYLRGDGSWKENVVIVNDGGSNFFNLKINLTTGQAYELYVNGEN